MKFKFITILGLASSMFFVSCKGGETEETATTDSTLVDSTAGSFAVDTAASIINWAGNTTGATIYGHSGVLKLNSGSLELTAGQISGGSFEINMTSLTATDSSYEFNEKSNPAALKGHLSSAEFFAIDSFPSAKFVITSVEAGKIIGELTIKGKTNTETITFSDLVTSDTEVSATGKLTIDRQKYGVAWKHFLKDTVLSDEIPLTVSLVAKK